MVMNFLSGPSGLLSFASLVQAIVSGSPADDRLYGTFGDDEIESFGGNDTIRARGGRDDIDDGDGNDVVRAGGGNDIIRGSEGADDLDGGFGYDDRLTYLSSDEAVQINLTARTQHGGYAEGDSLRGIEAVIGTIYNDHLVGANGSETLTGGLGDDTMFGGRGRDFLLGDLGDDSLSGDGGGDSFSGGDGADRMNGGRGNDVLNGGDNDGSLGADTMEGGAGADRFVFVAISNSNLLAGLDEIIDFQPGRDTLWLGSAIIDDTATFLGEAGSFSGSSDQVRYEHVEHEGADATLVSVQSESSGVPLQFLLTGAHFTLSVDDFHF